MHSRSVVNAHMCFVAQVRDKFGARVIFPASGDEQPDVVTIIGKKESVEQAKEHILEQIKELVSTTSLYYVNTCSFDKYP